MRALAVQRGVEAGELVGRVLCHDIRGPGNEIVFRKGHSLHVEDLARLADASWSEIHLIELGPGDIGQREAGLRLADILCCQGLQAVAAGHRHVLKAAKNGLLKIDVAALERLNSIPGIAVYTLGNDQVVAKDQVVADAQITPLAIDGPSLEAATTIAGESGSVIRVVPFMPRDTVVWTLDDRHLTALAEKLRWFGCPVREVVDLPRDSRTIAESMERHAGSGAALFLVSGSNALDPLDPVFEALRSLGATMQRIGMPVHPGTLLWIASWRQITIIGLPTCGLGTQLTAFDLVLPKLLAEGKIDDEALAGLGHGGILSPGTAQAARGRS
jgi:hypothetical protein